MDHLDFMDVVQLSVDHRVTVKELILTFKSLGVTVKDLLLIIKSLGILDIH